MPLWSYATCAVDRESQVQRIVGPESHENARIAKLHPELRMRTEAGGA